MWVRNTKTLYAETACASGTLAAAYYLYLRTGQTNFTITQPSDSNFKIKIIHNTISLSGPILTSTMASIL